jgi:hypothetical protein
LGPWRSLCGREWAIREPETTTGMPEPEVEVQRLAFDEEIRVAIVGAGGYGRVALDVLLAGGVGDRVLGFYDDAHAAISEKVRGYPVLGDVEMLKSMLSVEILEDSSSRLYIRSRTSLALPGSRAVASSRRAWPYIPILLWGATVSWVLGPW